MKEQLAHSATYISGAAVPSLCSVFFHFQALAANTHAREHHCCWASRFGEAINRADKHELRPTCVVS
jgi:hypothetical protein